MLAAVASLVSVAGQQAILSEGEWANGQESDTWRTTSPSFGGPHGLWYSFSELMHSPRFAKIADLIGG